MAAALTEDGFHVCFEVGQHVHRHKGLCRTGKAAAVHTHGTLALQVMLGGRNGHAHFLMLLVPGGDHILQVLPAAVAGSGDQLQEGVKVAAAQSSHLLRNPVVVGIEVEGAQHGAVAALSAALRELCEEGVKGHVPQHFTAAHGSHGAALGGHGGVLVGQVGMVGTGIQDAQGQACLGKVHLHRFHIRVGGVGKINGDDVAHAEAIWSIRPQGLPK